MMFGLSDAPLQINVTRKPFELSKARWLFSDILSWYASKYKTSVTARNCRTRALFLRNRRRGTCLKHAEDSRFYWFCRESSVMQDAEQLLEQKGNDAAPYSSIHPYHPRMWAISKTDSRSEPERMMMMTSSCHSSMRESNCPRVPK